MALKLKGSTSGFVAIDAPSVARNNTLILPENTGSAGQILANDITAGVTTFTSVTVNRNGDLTVPGTISIGGTLTYEDVTSVDSVGIVTARSGVRINGGGLTIIGDTTGLSATGFSTFSGGINVGAALTVNAFASTSLVYLSLRDGYKPDASGGMGFMSKDHTGSNADGIGVYGHDGLSFHTSQTERLRIDSSGRLLLGTTTEGHTDADDFTVSSSTNTTGITIRTNTSGTGRLWFSDGTSGGAEYEGYVQYDHVNNRLQLGAAQSTRLTINSGGNALFTGIVTATNFTSSGTVLIDTTSYSEATGDADDLIIGSTSDTQKGISIVGSTSGGIGNIYFTDGVGYKNQGRVSYHHADDSMRFTTNTTERLRIDSSGRLLYGVTSSTRETSLILQGNSNSYTTNPGVLELRVGQVPSSSSSLGSLVFGCTGDKIGGTINAIADNADWSSGSSHPTALRFFTTPASSTTQAERLRITRDGRVGINEDSPDNLLHIKDGNPYLEIEGTSNSGDAGIFFNAKSNHWNLRADNSGSQNSFGLKSGTPASSTHTISIVSTAIDFFQNRNIYQRTTSATHSIADGANKQFTITGLGYGWAKLQLAFYGEGHQCNVEVTLGGLMASGSQYYSATIIANGSSGSCDVNFGANQTSYVVTISNNVGNGGSLHGTALFTGSGGSAHPNIAVS